MAHGKHRNWSELVPCSDHLGAAMRRVAVTSGALGALGAVVALLWFRRQGAWYQGGWEA